MESLKAVMTACNSSGVRNTELHPSQTQESSARENPVRIKCDVKCGWCFVILINLKWQATPIESTSLPEFYLYLTALRASDK